MSFLMDPPLLFISGLSIFFLGKRLEWNRHVKIVIGIAIVLVFMIFSTLLYLDIIRCTFPFFSGMKASEFMFNTNLTGISKSRVPAIVVAFLFLLDPVWIFAGYASVLLLYKRRLFSKELYTYSDVKSKKKSKSHETAKNESSRASSIYSVVRGSDAQKCVAQAIDAIGGIDTFVQKGDKVLVKVNICGGVPEIKGTYTSTIIAEELVELIRSAGGEPIFADADMIWTKFWKAAEDSGWVEWAKRKNVRLVNLSETKIVNFDFGEGSALGIEKVSREIIDADVIISAPTMKTHLLTGVTLGMKNMYGTFPDVDKAKYHRKNIENTIYDVNKAFTPNLVVIDGSIGGEGIGPLSSKPVYFETIIASNDVVNADSIASQIMGYDPKEIVHIKMAGERGLGDASARFDFSKLPYKHPGGKDGNWDRPQPSVKDFYEWCIELILKLPGWETLFNVGADFFLYDLARLPILRNLTPAILQIMNDVVFNNIKGFKDTEKDRARRKYNVLMVLSVILAFAFGYCLDGYVWHLSLAFELSFLAAMAVSIIGALRMKTSKLAVLLISSALTATAVEHINISSKLLAYTGSADVSLFIITGWMLMMVTIMPLSDLLTNWLSGLGMFKKMQALNILPFVLSLVLLSMFFIWEGYFWIASKEVLVMYGVMVAVSLLYSARHSIEWNASTMVVSIAVGGYMELLGSLAGFWQYHFMEPLAVFFALTWSLNTWTVHGLASLVGIDLGAYKERRLLPGKTKDISDRGPAAWSVAIKS
ncbi:Uncharacterised protein [uncultured archaeon]|nr:Uncharacterised protein [uncultured archaeon]